MIQVVLQKAQNWRLIVTTVIYEIHERKFCQSLRIIVENYTFFLQFSEQMEFRFLSFFPQNLTAFRFAEKLCPYM